jgi:hypothetical protein
MAITCETQPEEKLREPACKVECVPAGNGRRMTQTTESGEGTSVLVGDRTAFRVWLGCGALLWLFGLVNWLSGLCSR